jgi:hypothetical protein
MSKLQDTYVLILTQDAKVSETFVLTIVYTFGIVVSIVSK